MPTALNWGKTLAWAVPMMLLTALLMAGGPNLPKDPRRLIPLVAVWLFANFLFLRMVRTRKTDRYRAPYFIAIALGFVLSFVPNLLEVRGNMALTDEDMLLGKTPFCHVVIPMTLIPAALTRTIISPGSILGQFAGIAEMFALWIGFSLVLGRGWCSWGCFFGGLDEFFSRLAKRPVICHIAQRWTYLPYAVLAVVVVTAVWELEPTYCMWLCPFIKQFISMQTLAQSQWLKNKAFGAIPCPVTNELLNKNAVEPTQKLKGAETQGLSVAKHHHPLGEPFAPVFCSPSPCPLRPCLLAS